MRKRYQIDDCLEDIELGEELLSIPSSGMGKNSLKGQRVVIEVFDRIFRDGRVSYEWAMADQTISAGGMEKASDCVEDIVDTLRETNPKHIELMFPPVKLSRGKTYISRRKRVTKLKIAGFKAAIQGMMVISIAE